MAITTAKGTIIKVSDAGSPGAGSAIGQVRSVAGPTVKPNLVDITTHDTPGFWRRKITALIDAGELSFDINFDSTDATHAFATGLWAMLVALTKVGLEVVFPNSNGNLLFQGYVAGHEFAAPVDNVLSAKITLGITDEITAS